MFLFMHLWKGYMMLFVEKNPLSTLPNHCLYYFSCFRGSRSFPGGIWSFFLMFGPCLGDRHRSGYRAQVLLLLFKRH